MKPGLTEKDLNIIEAAETCFLKSIKALFRIHRMRNDDVQKDLDIYAVHLKITVSRRNWREHHVRMDETGMVPYICRNERPRKHPWSRNRSMT